MILARKVSKKFKQEKALLEKNKEILGKIPLNEIRSYLNENGLDSYTMQVKELKKLCKKYRNDIKPLKLLISIVAEINPAEIFSEVFSNIPSKNIIKEDFDALQESVNNKLSFRFWQEKTKKLSQNKEFIEYKNNINKIIFKIKSEAEQKGITLDTAEIAEELGFLV